MKLQLSFWGSS